MIVITGAAGFISSCLISKLNDNGFTDIVAVDDFSNSLKLRNWNTKKIRCTLERKLFFDWLKDNQQQVEFIFHLGARTDTTEFNKQIFDELNLNYSKAIWHACVQYHIPLVYASSAATYGSGEFGYNDNESLIPQLKPLNPYGDSKNDFDNWALTQEIKPFFWAGLKFFNVYGPNEYHKGRMASVIFHAYHQIRETSQMKLFKSHRNHFNDGEQMRDFIYVKDVVDVCYFLMHHRKNSGIYNVGSGKARSFNNLVKQTFLSLGVIENIEYIDMPADIRETYQYFTEANMEKLKNIGYHCTFHSLEEGIDDYIKNYLLTNRYL
ncbi:MAG: ADP-glyceromanno-heptose 6-epimerase [Bacteroidota bacterium]